LAGLKGLKVKVACAEVSAYDLDAKPKWMYYESIMDGERGRIK
jgi:hypothetical protein